MKQKLINFFEATGLTWFVPITRLLFGEEPAEQSKEILKMWGYPTVAIILFFVIWNVASSNIKTSVGQLPTPKYVWSQAKAMWLTHKSESAKKELSEELEATRAELSALIEKRVKATDAASLDASIKTITDKLDAKVATLTKQRDDFKAVKDAAEKEKAETLAKMRQDFIDKGKALIVDGKPAMNVDGTAKLVESAEDEVKAFSYFRVAVLEGNMSEVLSSSIASTKSLKSKVDKVYRYLNTAKEIEASDLDAEAKAKKMASNDKKIAAFTKQIAKPVSFQGNGSIVDYVELSIITVTFGFFLAALVAIPIGILCGLSPIVMTALNPLIQTFRPVSPLAWVLITIQVIDGIFVGDNALEGDIVKNTFLHAGITVALCSMWATLSNTALGVSSVDKDHMNVAKVLKLNWFDRVFKIIIPSAIPYIFTGLRITLGVGWMVLIVSEMMATSRGLGWFIDQEYQNNKVESLANIIVCIFIIGFVGAVLDRIMFTLQRLVSFNDEVSA